ncbi:feruloyl-CoA synthase [Segeticoccus rhizosphaerae]|jgi:feruloyl-CoA synthase|uniref:feruloyl-CoA synthase n=1 Tax=Segeticoccus rhizosphaerae TaxID=1104777 RepID=UPI001396AAD4|nr:feruloyl-CoA synthase [Segeticoccus rhizosphaerae]
MTTLYATPRIVREDRPDGSILLRSADQLRPYPASILHSLREWASRDAHSLLVADRDGSEGWRTVTYGEAVAGAESIGQGLLDLGLGASRPLLVLSGNSVDHLLMMLGALNAGVPVVPTSTAYSLQSKDHARIRQVAELVTPGAVFADDADRFGAVLDTLQQTPAITSRGNRAVGATVEELRAVGAGSQVRQAFEGIGPETVAKILLTSGSTGAPKGVLTTHRMLASNQQMMRQVWPFLEEERPVIVDWLPWSHTFGGSHNLNMVVTNGGTLYVDDGGPPALSRSLANLADVPPTIYFNVPAGYAQLVPVLEDDPEFAEAFFSRLRLLFNAAAALPSALRQRLGAVAEKTTGRRIPVSGSWGLTETAPAVTNAHFDFDDARCIGVPLPGAEVLLRPEGEAYEILARGPMVTPGFFRRPDLTASAFDTEGFYRTGDAVRLADDADPDAGLLFSGRVAEDFKLTTGTFVRVGALRTSLLSALPQLSDAVIAGQDRDEACALAWLNLAETRKLLGRDPVAAGDAYVDPALAGHLARGLEVHSRGAGRAGRIERILLMTAPPDLDAGEITDKGYVNQRKVIELRSDLVDRLYDEPAHPSVVHVASSEASESR